MDATAYKAAKMMEGIKSWSNGTPPMGEGNVAVDDMEPDGARVA